MAASTGTVLWYRPASDQGVVRSDEGRQYFFSHAATLEPSTGLRVTFVLSEETPPKACSLALLGGGRTIASTPSPTPGPTKKAATPRAAPRAKSAASSESARPVAKAGAAKAAGTPVFHPQWGPGHVIGSTAHFVSVEFLSGGRRNVPDAELQDVGGQRGTPAPERKSRKGGFNDRPARPAGRTHVRRDRAGADDERPAKDADGGWTSFDDPEEG